MSENSCLPDLKLEADAELQDSNFGQSNLNKNDASQIMALVEKILQEQTDTSENSEISQPARSQDINSGNIKDAQMTINGENQYLTKNSNQPNPAENEVTISKNSNQEQHTLLELPDTNLKIIRIDGIIKGLQQKTVLKQLQIYGEVKFLNYDWSGCYILIRFADNKIAEMLVDEKQSIILSGVVYTPRWTQIEDVLMVHMRNNQENTWLWIGNVLIQKMGLAKMLQLMRQCGTIVSYYTPKVKNQAFVQMETIEQARSVMIRIDGLIINDQVVIINYAKGVITNEV
ncbi:MAG: hypothetical protein EZS28_033236 [Streblomastix strix]|uniref:RRM domain-containing protein n=1 Tax=Streblomastix strix TaxID=222440 RepID=A0A5J4ULG2_9EUKA|nr:MAG: hypothetical protein EZS28_033236 [Streblomastix strix]